MAGLSEAANWACLAMDVPRPHTLQYSVQALSHRDFEWVMRDTLCSLCALLLSMQISRTNLFHCPHFAHIRRVRSLYQDADGTMQCFVWHKDQKAVCHCLAAILNVADDSNTDASS